MIKLTKLWDSMFCSNSETCTAIIDGTECGEKSYGRGCVNGVQIHFCEKHIPSNAMPAGGRTKSIEFVSEDGKTFVKTN